MTDIDMKRNGAGYYDGTPYQAVFKGAYRNPGEIWGTSHGREYLIIAVQNNNLYTAIQLIDHDKEGCIKIQSRQIMYANPAMIQYMFGQNLTEFIKELPMEQFDAIVEAVQDALCININVNKVEDTRLDEMQAVIDKQKNEMAALREELRQERHNYDEAVRERDHFSAQTANLMRSAIDEGTYKKLYYEMLDRLIQHGRA